MAESARVQALTGIRAKLEIQLLSQARIRTVAEPLMHVVVARGCDFQDTQSETFWKPEVHREVIQVMHWNRNPFC
jgi:hypothetical protein